MVELKVVGKECKQINWGWDEKSVVVDVSQPGDRVGKRRTTRSLN